VLVSQLKVAITEARWQFGDPEEEERPPFEIVNRRLVKTRQTEKDCVLYRFS
jgi:hypothetical protein